MANQVSAIGSFLLGGRDDGNVQRTTELKLRGRTLIFGNTIYQLRNIASLEVVDLTIIKRFPMYILLLGLVGLFLLSTRGTTLVGIALLALAAYLAYTWYNTRTNERYGLSIITNAGSLGSVTLVSKDLDFLKQIAVTINNLMNSEDEAQAISFNFDQRKIDIETMTNSSLVAGNVHGDLVNNV
ncbi:MAG: hypothetical protein KC547_12150 [Anaerolineae bacterium]|nr:hypothetical protein [Anaerolineae bacterium]